MSRNAIGCHNYYDLNYPITLKDADVLVFIWLAVDAGPAHRPWAIGRF